MKKLILLLIFPLTFCLYGFSKVPPKPVWELPDYERVCNVNKQCFISVDYPSGQEAALDEFVVLMRDSYGISLEKVELNYAEEASVYVDSNGQTHVEAVGPCSDACSQPFEIKTRINSVAVGILIKFANEHLRSDSLTKFY